VIGLVTRGARSQMRNGADFEARRTIAEKTLAQHGLIDG
jgi:hypothetical protein